MKKIGKVYYNETFAGTIEQSEGEYRFQYDLTYLKGTANKPVSMLLPLRSEPYIEKTMIPFFDGLIPEGWLLNIAETNWKLDRKDRMSLLLALCNDCIGAVKVIDASPEEPVAASAIQGRLAE
ncbi:MAG: HipA N-terminal domain-containing protein [Bdellovibrionales bacterium]|nr:HipA N-terminal domain-containing protein [Bdellovibrionales bacterium]MCB0413682.1 HipA N-terminal domain-containing protein [Bdellovibrionales bacterium]